MSAIKTIVAAVILFMGSNNTFSQSFKNGDRLVNAGIGIGGGLGLPVGASYEQAVSDNISVGGSLAYSRKKESWSGYGDWRYSYILAGARGAYHLKVNSDRFDPYGGATLGYNIASVKWSGDESEPISASAGGFMWGIHLGSRYWTSQKVGVYAEIGYGTTLLNVGVAIRI